MIHKGRHRYRSHGGIPQTAFAHLAADLSFYLQNNRGINAGEWKDQSPNDNHVTQGIAGDQATVTNGGYDFESSEADHYDFATQIEISTQEGFALYIVCEVESIGTNMTILGLNATTHFIEFLAGGDSIRMRLASTTTTITPTTSNLFNVAAGKFLLCIERESGATGNINLYKNGVLLSQSSQAANTGDGEFIVLGNRNADRYFDGIIYDIGMIEANDNTRNIRDRMTAYLMSKHGLSF